MRTPSYRGAWLILIFLLSATLCLAAIDLSWYTIDGGGQTSVGGTFEVSGTIGQPDAGVLAGGTYSLTGGFWSGLTPPPITIVAWRSIRTHSGLGALAISLDALATGNGLTGPTAEPRLGFVGRNDGLIQQIQVQFSDPVLLINAAAVVVTGQTTVNGVLQAPVTYGPTGVILASSNVLAITFDPPPSSSALPGDTCYLINVAGSVQGTLGQVLTGDTDCRVRSLLGDVTSSGLVNLSDALATKARIGQPVATNTGFDLDLSGAITNADSLLAKSQVVSPAHMALCP